MEHCHFLTPLPGGNYGTLEALEGLHMNGALNCYRGRLPVHFS
jgi:hypothetical protein